MEYPIDVWHIHLNEHDIETVNSDPRGWSATPKLKAYADITMLEDADTAAAMFVEGMYWRVLSIQEVGPIDTFTGTVEGALESLYRMTQNIDTSWVTKAEATLDISFSERPPLELPQIGGQRSSMVGDIFRVHDEYYMVGSLGFDHLPELSRNKVSRNKG